MKHLEHDKKSEFVSIVEGTRILTCVSDEGKFLYGDRVVTVGNGSVIIFPCVACYAELQSVLFALFTEGISDKILKEIRRNHDRKN